MEEILNNYQKEREQILDYFQLAYKKGQETPGKMMIDSEGLCFYPSNQKKSAMHS